MNLNSSKLLKWNLKCLYIFTGPSLRLRLHLQKENTLHLALLKNSRRLLKNPPTYNSQLLMGWEHSLGWCKRCDRYFKGGEGIEKVWLRLTGDWPHSWLVVLPPFSGAVVFSHAGYWIEARSGISLVVLLVLKGCGGHRCSAHIHRALKTNRA